MTTPQPAIDPQDAAERRVRIFQDEADARFQVLCGEFEEATNLVLQWKAAESNRHQLLAREMVKLKPHVLRLTAANKNQSQELKTLRITEACLSARLRLINGLLNAEELFNPIRKQIVVKFNALQGQRGSQCTVEFLDEVLPEDIAVRDAAIRDRIGAVPAAEVVRILYHAKPLRNRLAHPDQTSGEGIQHLMRWAKDDEYLAPRCDWIQTVLRSVETCPQTPGPQTDDRGPQTEGWERPPTHGRGSPTSRGRSQTEGRGPQTDDRGPQTGGWERRPTHGRGSPTLRGASKADGRGRPPTRGRPR